MTEREKLIELLDKKYDHFCDQCGVNKDSRYTENLADYLLANGIVTNIVRCKDCKYHKTDAFGQKMCMRGFIYFQMNDDDYCSYGEKEVNENDRA